MTPHPADEVRRALREARERAGRGESGPDEPSRARPEPDEKPGPDEEPGPDEKRAAPRAGDPPPETTAAEGPAVAAKPVASRPGDVAREALRQAVAARRGSAPGEVSDEAQGDVGGATTPVADPQATPGHGDDEGPDHTEEAAAPAPAVEGATSRRGDTRPGDVATRPGDAAREALRAARTAARQAPTDPAPPVGRSARGPRRTPPAAPARGEASRRAVGPQARDVRRLLADAFRMPDEEMPTEVDGDDNSGAPQAGSANEASTAGPDPQDSGSAVTVPAAPEVPHRTTDPSPRTPHSHSTPHSMAPSMAAPSRDGDLRRTFPAFPPRPRESDEEGFARTWWGNAWVEALEKGALDAKRLARGRGYAEKGHVDAITVTPGLVLAYVQGSRPRPYRVQVRLRTLDDEDWDRLLHGAAERTGDIAALLDREMPPSLAESGVPLLPGPRELDPRCSCPDSGHPCKHAAALCYQTARLLDADPFVLLLLRGRGERELLDALSRLSAARAARAAQEQGPAPLPGVRATEALAPRRLPPLPPPLPVPPHPEQPPVYPATAGGPDPFALDQLATDAAARAHALLATGRDPVGELTLWQDAVRLAAARPGSGLTAGSRGLYSSLATVTDRTPADLARAVAAWRQGGLEGLAVLEEPWDPPAGRFDRARPLLLAADLPAFRPWRNRLTHPRGHVQLRLGRDGLWYAYESEPGRDDWWPRGTPDLDPVGALTGLGTPGDL
ncbi:SWIM zinc finger family protein [Streptomyces sp. YU58]|uniref:SWIM zinc finger family protein n=1 Tax=Streptomyces sp. SX92 TaxID=3158972 RepID=UPI0027B8C223|nr:SWIM zinc finger family protein [Streptomyces coralus]WLW51201.1 SWIM zinc finger family protein [Streptomyces coralus]